MRSATRSALEALIRFTDEELKHQELFRRIEALVADGHARGLPVRAAAERRGVVRPRQVDVGRARRSPATSSCSRRPTIARASRPTPELSPLFKDVFFFHWKEESQHAILDELEWRREDAQLSAEARDSAVDDLIALVAGIDAMLQAQAAADAHYFVEVAGRPFDAAEVAAIGETTLRAYRWQYIVSGVSEPRFAKILNELITPEQGERIGLALAPLLDS